MCGCAVKSPCKVVVPHLAAPKTKKLGRAIDSDGLALSTKALAGALTDNFIGLDASPIERTSWSS